MLETFYKIAGAYFKFKRVQDQRNTAVQKGEAISKSIERRYRKHNAELVDLMQTVRLNNNRIEALVDQLYGLNRRLVHLEGRLLRLTVDRGIKREDFLEQYKGCELDPNWLDRVQALPGKRWKAFAVQDRAEIEEIREGIIQIAAGSGLQLDEFRRIAQTVQLGQVYVDLLLFQCGQGFRNCADGLAPVRKQVDASRLGRRKTESHR